MLTSDLPLTSALSLTPDPPTRACHSAHHVATSLISVTFFFVFTKHTRDGAGVQIWTLASLVRGKSHFMSVRARVCVYVCECVGMIYGGGVVVVLT